MIDLLNIAFDIVLMSGFMTLLTIVSIVGALSARVVRDYEK